ncbi:MAG TPA: CPBP family glutamic-type intramembrane protease [Blastocatellia bacterium]|nr:CPBP family glutamic-type intramembrane protease [Blastocatellia bacterium]
MPTLHTLIEWARDWFLAAYFTRLSQPGSAYKITWNMVAPEVSSFKAVTGTSKEAGAASENQIASRAGRHIAELACLILLIETVMWIVPLMPNPRLAYTYVAILIIMLLVVTHLRDRLTVRSVGIRFDNFLPVLARVAMPLGLFVAAMILIGIWAGSLRLGERFISMLLFVPVWAMIQQYMLFGFAYRRFRALLGPGTPSVVASTALFSLIHLPNPILTVVCAYGGYIWSRTYDREPNLIVHALTHGIASAVLANSLPGWLLKNMVVGYNYFFR